MDEDDFMLEMIDAGAEEVDPEDESFIITGSKEDFGSIQAKLEELSITPEEASLQQLLQEGTSPELGTSSGLHTAANECV